MRDGIVVTTPARTLIDLRRVVAPETYRRALRQAEIQGHGHRGRQAFEDDHERDLYLRTQGYRVLRFTARQIRSDPGTVARVVLTKLGV